MPAYVEFWPLFAAWRQGKEEPGPVKLLITGGAGFIGSHFVTRRLASTSDEIVVLDALTYAGTLENLSQVRSSDRFLFEEADLRDLAVVQRIVREHKPQVVVHLAAESHVDRSFGSPGLFFQTNVLGTINLLTAWREAGGGRFLFVSTDEVYGSPESHSRFLEDDRLNPCNPYSASKASAEHACRSFAKSFGIDVVIVRPSNNYGTRQHSEKLIPKLVLHATRGEKLPLHGDGRHQRDWLHVEDLCSALSLLLESGVSGEIYNVAGHNCLENIEVAQKILRHLKLPTSQICFVADRPSNDAKYAIEDKKICSLGYRPQKDFSRSFEETVAWYRDQYTSS